MFISTVDDYSRMSWIFLINKKSQFPQIFKQFVTFIEKQTGTQVKCIRTDNTKELTKDEALQFCTQRGIKQESSCTDTPQQNRVVERKQRH